MSYFVLSVQPRKEGRFLTVAHNTLDTTDITFVWPRRSLTIRKGGKRFDTVAPVFPGYIFINAEEISHNLYLAIKRLPGFYRFLDSNEQIRPLSARDEEIVAHFVRFGEVAGKSLVTFDANNRIRVSSGPLAGLEGMIVKVDKRKRRAKVKLDLYSDSFLVDLGFEIIESSKTKVGE